MTKYAEEIEIATLFFAHPQIYKKKVGRFAMKIKDGLELDPIIITQCVHNGNYYLDDGHNRTMARHYLGMRTVKALVEECIEVYPECKGIGTEYYHRLEDMVLR